MCIVVKEYSQLTVETHSILVFIIFRSGKYLRKEIYFNCCYYQLIFCNSYPNERLEDLNELHL